MTKDAFYHCAAVFSRETQALQMGKSFQVKGGPLARAGEALPPT